MKLKGLAPHIVILVLIFVGCWQGERLNTPATPTVEPVTLNVFAAASLTDAFTEISQAFTTKSPGVDVVFNFAGSNQLSAQIANGAPADVFASANQRQMDAAVASGRIDPDAGKPFLTNRLVVTLPVEASAGIYTLSDLAVPGTLIVLAAEEVPAGQYALEFLEKASQDPGFSPAFRDDVLKNVVSYEENVRAVLNKVVLGEADAGIVYTSDAASVDQATIEQLDIPELLNVTAVYPIAPLNDSPQPDVARAFVEYVLSPAGQAILTRYGFGPKP
jgi:molybdate transport system substrate-binding protein